MREYGDIIFSSGANQGEETATVNIKDTGNVGIGTTEPTEKLEVAGKVKAGAFVGDGSELTGIATGKWSEGGGGIFYDGGNVGIGTASPGQKLEVAGNAIVNNAFLGDVGHGADFAAFCHKDIVGLNSFGFLQTLDGLTTLINKKSGGGQIGFRVDNVDKMVVLDSGNVGIGTTTPTAKLDVAGTIKATGLEISGSLSLPGSDLIFLNLPDARTSPPGSDLETVVVDKATGKLYMQ